MRDACSGAVLRLVVHGLGWSWSDCTAINWRIGCFVLESGDITDAKYEVKD